MNGTQDVSPSTTAAGNCEILLAHLCGSRARSSAFTVTLCIRFWITYDDGDEEELSWTDLQKFLLPVGQQHWQQHEQQHGGIVMQLKAVNQLHDSLLP